MITKRKIADFALSALDQKIEAILLRGTDDNSRLGGDIDIVVPAGQAAKAAVCIGEAAVSVGWSVVGFRHLGYVAQICLLIPNPAGIDDTAIKIDLSDGLAWYALGNDLIGEAIFRLQSEGTSEAQAAGLATFFQKMLYPGFLRDRDKSRIFAAIDPEEINTFCVKNNLPVSMTEIEAGLLKKKTRWQLRAVSANARGISMLPWVLMAVWSALRARLGVRTGGGQIIGVSGMDGSGKSTLVDRFVRALTIAEFTEPELVHLLPEVIPTPHKIIRRKSSVENYTRPYSEPPVRSRLSAISRLGYYILAFSAARIWCGVKVTRGATIIFDRSIVDFSSDLARARIPHVQLPKWLLKALLPPGLFFYIDATAETVVARKGELTHERASELSRRYLATSKALNIIRIDGEVDAHSVFGTFISVVTEKNMRRARLRALL
jgi:thymidylate kinase